MKRKSGTDDGPLHDAAQRGESRRGAVQGEVPDSARFNGAFNDYYRQQLQLDAPEHEAFLAALKTPSPMCCRIHQTRPPHIQAQVARRLASFGGELVPLKWPNSLLPNNAQFPEDVVWSCSHEEYHSRPDLEAWARSAKVAGELYFQESVSMLPVLLLGLEAHHCVADLCAAPGSKTTLALDIMQRANRGQSPFPPGFVLANEFDAKRATSLLANKIRVIATPAAIVTVCSAQNLPCGNAFFDRVLADVPCSGDGTLRKDPSIWSRWTPRDGLELHATQLRILKRALKLVKPGGLIAYSTCSFNPIECEAVVAAALLGARAEQDAAEVPGQSDDEYEVVPIPNERLPENLSLSPGLTAWRVPVVGTPSDDQDDYTSGGGGGGGGGGERGDSSRFCRRRSRVWNGSFSDSFSKTAGSGVKRSMYPCAGGYSRLNEQLVNCARLYPHRHDCGGFFVALIRRRPMAPASKSAAHLLGSEGGGSDIGSIGRSKAACDDTPATARGEPQGSNCPLQSLSHEFESEWGSIVEFYGIGTVESKSLLLESDRRLVLATASSAHFVETELRTIPPAHRGKLVVHSGGLRVLLKMPPSALRAAQNTCRWRPTQEGAAWLAQRATKRKLRFSAAALLNLVINRAMNDTVLRDLEQRGEVSGLPSLSLSDGSLIAGGIFVGLMDVGAADVEARSDPEAAPETSDWSWIACMCLSKEVVVYAHDTALWHIRDYLSSSIEE